MTPNLKDYCVRVDDTEIQGCIFSTLLQLLPQHACRDSFADGAALIINPRDIK